uniref:Uncharacterized protein n=1 Tax=Rhizophora mucronata TaxID=61149 RepID=A0A2P2J8V7_RHIMU
MSDPKKAALFALQVTATSSSSLPQ